METYQAHSYVANNPIMNNDPLGLAIWLCNRKVRSWVIGKGLSGNHAYLWDDRNNSCCGRASAKSCKEKGPNGGDSCVKIADSNGKEDNIMKCCKETADDGIWFPPINDCHTAAEDCIKGSGLKSPGAPGGRIGKPCDPCWSGSSGNW